MTNRKLIKYAVALERIREVARRDNWGTGSSIFYQSELEEDKENYARRMSGYKGRTGRLEDLCFWCKFSFIAGLIGTIAGVVYAADKDICHKITVGSIGFVVGGFVTGAISLAKMYFDEYRIEKVIEKRDRRKEARENFMVRKGQRKSTYMGLMTSESMRADNITKEDLTKFSAH